MEMRNELEVQIKRKIDRGTNERKEEKVKVLQQIAETEQKLIKDELQAISHNESVRKNISMKQQYDYLNRQKMEVAQRERAASYEQRKMIDEQIRQANLADAKLISDKRNSLR